MFITLNQVSFQAFYFANVTYHGKKICIFVISDQISPRKVFSVQNKNSEHPQRIQHIRINLFSKFHLKQTILNFFL